MQAILLALTLILLSACESGGTFRVVNRTSFPLYVTVGDEAETVIPGQTEHSFEISTDKQHIFNPGVERRVPVRLLGETYEIYNDYAGVYTDSTTITIKAGKTLSAYFDPNRASFKVVNNSSQSIASVMLLKHNFISIVGQSTLTDIPPGEFRFLRVEYASPNNNFYYLATVVMDDEDETTYNYGNELNVLENDQQFLITVVDPER